MFGEHEAVTHNNAAARRRNRQQRGVIPRACEEVLAACELRRGEGIESRLGVSYVEIYANDVTGREQTWRA